MFSEARATHLANSMAAAIALGACRVEFNVALTVMVALLVARTVVDFFYRYYSDLLPS